MIKKIILLAFAAGALLLASQKEKTSATFNHGEWDKSSLTFQGACNGDCHLIQAEICNTGDGDMAGPVDFEVWYAASGNPKNGINVGGGQVPALESGECTDLHFDPQASGNYMFKAFQRPGHPGKGELWSEDCHLEGCEEEPTPTPRHTPTPTPTGHQEPTPTPTLPPDHPTPTPTLTPTPTVIPEPTPTHQPEIGGPVNGGQPGPAGPSVCTASVPSAPILTNVISSGVGQVNLLWTAVTPVTHYSISYGLSPQNYIYGVDNTGNVTSFTVGSLDPGVRYCFAVRAVNDCAPSGPSNEICTGKVLGTGQVLGVSTLGATGSFAKDFFQILFIMGSVCLGLGLKLFLPAKKLA